MMEESLSNLLSQNKQFILLLIGIPASGKSTYAKELCKNYPNIKRINKDDIRNLLNEPFSYKFEKIVLEKERDNGINFLEGGFSVIVDDTNINQKHFNYWLEIANVFKIPIKVKIFKISLEEAIKRDQNRKSSVGFKVINDMQKLLENAKWIIDLKKDYLG